MLMSYNCDLIPLTMQNLNFFTDLEQLLTLMYFFYAMTMYVYISNVDILSKLNDIIRTYSQDPNFQKYIYTLLINAPLCPTWYKLLTRFFLSIDPLISAGPSFFPKIKEGFSQPELRSDIVDFYEEISSIQIQDEDIIFMQNLIFLMVSFADQLLIENKDDFGSVQMSSYIYHLTIDITFEFYGMEANKEFSQKLFEHIYQYMLLLIQVSVEEFFSVYDILCKCIAYEPQAYEIKQFSEMKQYIMQFLSFTLTIINSNITSNEFIKELLQKFQSINESGEDAVLFEFICLQADQNLTPGLYILLSESSVRIRKTLSTSFALKIDLNFPPIPVLHFIKNCCEFVHDHQAKNLLDYTFYCIGKIPFENIGDALCSLSKFYSDLFLVEPQKYYQPLLSLLTQANGDLKTIQQLLITLLFTTQKLKNLDEATAILTEFGKILSQIIVGFSLDDMNSLTLFCYDFISPIIENTKYLNPLTKPLMQSFYNNMFEILFQKIQQFLPADDSQIIDMISDVFILSIQSEWIKDNKILFDIIMQNININIESLSEIQIYCDNPFENPYFKVLIELPELFPNEKLTAIFSQMNPELIQKYILPGFSKPIKYCYILTEMFIIPPNEINKVLQSALKEFENCLEYKIKDFENILLQSFLVFAKRTETFNQTCLLIIQTITQYLYAQTGQQLDEKAVEMFRNDFFKELTQNDNLQPLRQSFKQLMMTVSVLTEYSSNATISSEQVFHVLHPNSG